MKHLFEILRDMKYGFIKRAGYLKILNWRHFICIVMIFHIKGVMNMIVMMALLLMTFFESGAQIFGIINEIQFVVWIFSMNFLLEIHV